MLLLLLLTQYYTEVIRNACQSCKRDGNEQSATKWDGSVVATTIILLNPRLPLSLTIVVWGWDIFFGQLEGDACLLGNTMANTHK